MDGRREPRTLFGSRVLVVEDEFFIADDLRSALVDAGAEVIGPVSTCAEGLAIVRTEAVISFAILDINLGGELCFPIADALMDRDVPFLFATGYEQAIVPARFAHVVRWEKPFDLSAIIDAVPLMRRQ